jgi:hypothetical protein
MHGTLQATMLARYNGVQQAWVSRGRRGRVVNMKCYLPVAAGFKTAVLRSSVAIMR